MTDAPATTASPKPISAAVVPPRAKAPPAPPAFPAPRRLLVVGDSVAYLLRHGLHHQAPPWMTVVDDGIVACTPGGGDHPQMRFDDGSLIRDPCSNSLTEWPREVKQTRSDGVLMLFGTSGLERQFGDAWRGPCDATYDSWLQSSLEASMRALQRSGARVWITLVPYNRHASITAKIRAKTDHETDCLNRLYQAAAQQVGGVAVLDLHQLVCPAGPDCVQEISGIELRPDGLHFEGPGADLIARWMLRSLGTAPRG